MKDVNWWMMTLAFLLGLLLTFAMMIRRVVREVPVRAAVLAPVAKEPYGPGSVRLAAAAVVASIEEVPAGPYGRGSAAPGADGAGPAGWPIKGNVDSMLYHPPDSPAYTETIAEVWFFDEETAKAAGFDKWDKNFR